MTDTPLVLPHDVEGVIVQTVVDHHKEHLAKVERSRGMQPRSIRPFQTVARMSDSQGLRLSGDTLPSVLFGIIGAPQWRRNEDEGIDALFQMGCEITVRGQKRSDTLMRRDVMAFSLIECIYQRVPRGRGNPIDDVLLTDYEPIADAVEQRTIGQARMIWEVGVANVMSVTGFLPPADIEWPPAAGGTPTDPYTPPEPRPTVESVTFTLDRKAITE